MKYLYLPSVWVSRLNLCMLNDFPHVLPNGPHHLPLTHPLFLNLLSESPSTKLLKLRN